MLMLILVFATFPPEQFLRGAAVICNTEAGASSVLVWNSLMYWHWWWLV